MASLDGLHFDNVALRELPVDSNASQEVKNNVPGVCYSLVNIEPLHAPLLVCASKAAFSAIGVNTDEISDAVLAMYFSGNRQMHGSVTYSHCYCGYQFGFFSGQLGDGAATSLGEVVTESGDRWELQLKGAGKTPYSRMGDGRKVLRSSLREFLCSEAMHFLVRTIQLRTCHVEIRPSAQLRKTPSGLFSWLAGHTSEVARVPVHS